VDVTQQARDEALSGLASWAASEADLPHAEAPETAAARLLGVAEGPAGPQVQIASDGLSLDRKLAIEQAIRTASTFAAPRRARRPAAVQPRSRRAPAPLGSSSTAAPSRACVR
jgi:hypothetical protein